MCTKYSSRGFWNFWRITFTNAQVRHFQCLFISFPKRVHTLLVNRRTGFATQCIHRRKSTSWDQGESHSQLLGGPQGVLLFQEHLFLTLNPSTQFWESKVILFIFGLCITWPWGKGSALQEHLSRLGSRTLIREFLGGSVGYCGMGLMPGPGTSAYHRGSQKIKKKTHQSPAKWEQSFGCDERKN